MHLTVRKNKDILTSGFKVKMADRKRRNWMESAQWHTKAYKLF